MYRIPIIDFFFFRFHSYFHLKYWICSIEMIIFALNGIIICLERQQKPVINKEIRQINKIIAFLNEEYRKLFPWKVFWFMFIDFFSILCRGKYILCALHSNASISLWSSSSTPFFYTLISKWYTLFVFCNSARYSFYENGNNFI